MDAYRNAITRNPGCFQGKVVLDVGAGSGVLSIWAAMAGARKVYAVEATSMAQHARRLVQQNGFQDVIVVLEGYMEKQELPEKVDIILSEWMGYFLLREAMFDSVLAARDLWLKPGGAMYPSHADLRMAPLCSVLYSSRMNEHNEEIGARTWLWLLPQPLHLTHVTAATLGASMLGAAACACADSSALLLLPRAFTTAAAAATLSPFSTVRSARVCVAAGWENFGRWMADGNGINVAGLTEFFHREQTEYLLQSAQWCQLHQSEVIGHEFSVSTFDLHTTTVKELSAFSTPFTSTIVEDAVLNAFGGWYAPTCTRRTLRPRALRLAIPGKHRSPASCFVAVALALVALPLLPSQPPPCPGSEGRWWADCFFPSIMPGLTRISMDPRRNPPPTL